MYISAHKTTQQPCYTDVLSFKHLAGKLVSEVDHPKMLSLRKSVWIYPPVKSFKVIPRVHSKTLACKVLLTSWKQMLTNGSTQVTLCPCITGGVCLSVPKHSRNKPQPTESGLVCCMNRHITSTPTPLFWWYTAVSWHKPTQAEHSLFSHIVKRCQADARCILGRCHL